MNFGDLFFGFLGAIGVATAIGIVVMIVMACIEYPIGWLGFLAFLMVWRHLYLDLRN